MRTLDGPVPASPPSVTAEVVTLVVSELVTNAVRYGRGQIRLVLRVRRGEVFVAVQDGGTAFVLLFLLVANPFRAGGRGLPIIAELASDSGPSKTWARQAMLCGASSMRGLAVVTRPVCVQEWRSCSVVRSGSTSRAITSLGRRPSTRPPCDRADHMSTVARSGNRSCPAAGPSKVCRSRFDDPRTMGGARQTADAARAAMGDALAKGSRGGRWSSVAGGRSSRAAGAAAQRRQLRRQRADGGAAEVPGEQARPRSTPRCVSCATTSRRSTRREGAEGGQGARRAGRPGRIRPPASALAVTKTGFGPARSPPRSRCRRPSRCRPSQPARQGRRPRRKRRRPRRRRGRAGAGGRTDAGGGGAAAATAAPRRCRRPAPAAAGRRRPASARARTPPSPRSPAA